MCPRPLWPSPRPLAPGASLVRPHRVLLLSLDGFHDFDLTNYTAAHPGSALAEVGTTCTRVGIFLSVFNVHVNRAPIEHVPRGVTGLRVTQPPPFYFCMSFRTPV